MTYELRWFKESVKNLEDILEDLRFRWIEKKVSNFKEKLSPQLQLIVQNPLLFPLSTQKDGLRRAVLSKQTTIFYKIIGDVVFLAYIHEPSLKSIFIAKLFVNENF
jgi:plasmid stabilization system protein ParE